MDMDVKKEVKESKPAGAAPAVAVKQPQPIQPPPPVERIELKKFYISDVAKFSLLYSLFLSIIIWIIVVFMGLIGYPLLQMA